MLRILFFLAVLYSSTPTVLQGQNEAPPTTPFPGITQEWTQHVNNVLSIDQKIGQLFILPTTSTPTSSQVVKLEELIQHYSIGGLIFMQGTPQEQVCLVNHYQKVSQIPLLMAQDVEWGLSMRLKDTMRFPKNMTLGAVQDIKLIFLLGKEIGSQCKRVGIGLDLGPVVDVNTNSYNPIIHNRSYGENPKKVAEKGVAFMKGLRESGIIACAKHFPGYGSISTDPHSGLPTLTHSRERLDAVDLYPFKQMIGSGVQAVMVAHMLTPSLESSSNIKSDSAVRANLASLSPAITSALLNKTLGFQGLIIPDALNMKAISQNHSPEKAAVGALIAGNDVLLFADHRPEEIDKLIEAVPRIIQAIKLAIKEGALSVELISQKAEKMLLAKEWLGLNKKRFTPSLNSPEALFSKEAIALNRLLYQKAITLLKNDDCVLPATKGNITKGNITKVNVAPSDLIAYVQIAEAPTPSFHDELKQFNEINGFFLKANATEEEMNKVLVEIQDYPLVIVGAYESALSDVIEERHALKSKGITPQTITFLHKLDENGQQTVLTLFSSPYHLKHFGEETAIVMAYENTPEAERAAAEVIFGAIGPEGRLPVTGSPEFPEGSGISYP